VFCDFFKPFFYQAVLNMGFELLNNSIKPTGIMPEAGKEKGTVLFFI